MTALHFEDLCAQLEFRLAEAENLCTALDAATGEIKSLRAELERTQTESSKVVNGLNSKVNSVQVAKDKVIQSQDQVIHNLKRKNDAQKAEITRLMAFQDKEKQRHAQAVQAEQDQAIQRQQKYEYLLRKRIDNSNGLPKSVFKSVFSHKRALLGQPFVVVLVDGDGYGVCFSESPGCSQHELTLAIVLGGSCQGRTCWRR